MSEIPKITTEVVGKTEEAPSNQEVARMERERLPEKKPKAKKALMALTLMIGVAIASRANAAQPVENVPDQKPDNAVTQNESVEAKSMRIMDNLISMVEINNPKTLDHIRKNRDQSEKDLIDFLEKKNLYNLENIENDPVDMINFVNEVANQAYREEVLRTRGLSNEDLKNKTLHFWDVYREHSSPALSDKDIADIESKAKTISQLTYQESETFRMIGKLIEEISRIKDADTRNMLLNKLVGQNER